MLSELTRAIYDTSAMDWATAEKCVYAMLVYLEQKLPPEDYQRIKANVLGQADYQLPDRSFYPGYRGDIPDQIERR